MRVDITDRDQKECGHVECSLPIEEKFLGKYLCGKHYTEALDGVFPPKKREGYMKTRAMIDACHHPCY